MEKHELEGTTCKCNPKIEYEEAEMLIIHNAFDNREIIEDVNKIINNKGDNKMFASTTRERMVMELALEILNQVSPKDSDYEKESEELLSRFYGYGNCQKNYQDSNKENATDILNKSLKPKGWIKD